MPQPWGNCRVGGFAWSAELRAHVRGLPSCARKKLQRNCLTAPCPGTELPRGRSLRSQPARELPASYSRKWPSAVLRQRPPSGSSIRARSSHATAGRPSLEEQSPKGGHTEIRGGKRRFTRPDAQQQLWLKLMASRNKERYPLEYRTNSSLFVSSPTPPTQDRCESGTGPSVLVECSIDGTALRRRASSSSCMRIRTCKS
jgi:hypothetical protein